MARTAPGKPTPGCVNQQKKNPKTCELGLDLLDLWPGSRVILLVKTLPWDCLEIKLEFSHMGFDTRAQLSGSNCTW